MLPLLALAALLTLALASSARASTGASSGKGKRFTGQRKSDLITFNIVNDVVSESPSYVASVLSQKLGRTISLTTAALATMLASEVGSGPQLAKIGTAHAVLNKAKRDGVSPFAVLSPDGRFASQGTPSHGYISTARPPSKADVLLAEAILAGRYKDPTGGALQFDSPSGQRKAIAAGLASYKSTPEILAADRISAGMIEINLPGVSPDYLRFWRPAVG